MIKSAHHVVSWFLRTFGYRGITLPPFGIYLLPHSLSDERLIRHEQCHWQQAQRLGLIRWYILYGWYTIRHGYWDNPFEIEARAAE